MNEIILDLECDGLYDTLTKIWVIGVKDVETGRTQFYSDEESPPTDGSLQEGLRVIQGAEKVIGHNLIDYDYPVIEKLLEVELDYDKVFDTLVVSRLLNPDRRKPSNYTGKSGPHSLDAWGCRVGKAKPGHDTWDVFDTAMLRRNRGDLEVNNLVYSVLRSEIKGHNWSHAIEIEHKIRRIITRQEHNGVNFDLSRAHDLLTTLDDKVKCIDDELLPNLPKSCKSWGTTISKPFKNNGDRLKRVNDWFDQFDDCSSDLVAGPFTRLDWIEMNLGSMAQVKKHLLAAGWQPTEWNYNDNGDKTSPKLTEDSYGTISGNIGSLIKDRLLLKHRRSQIQGWVDRVRHDGRLSAGANTCGTNTRRFRHVNVVNVPKAKDYIFLGKEMRSLFCAPKGRRIVGHDASGLELRMLAHYMNDPEFTEAVIYGKESDGTDIHTVNQRLAGLPTRDDAKTFIYAFLYGAGNEKIGSIVGGDANAGAALKRRFLKNLPALAELIKKVKKASGKGWLRGLDGSKIFMRRGPDGSVLTHKALNTLLQSAGAIVMKESIVVLDEAVSYTSIDALKVLDMHDEAQWDVALKDCKEYMELAEMSLVKAGENLEMKVPLAAEAKMGLNWMETH